jgi:hypothetical protein
MREDRPQKQSFRAIKLFGTVIISLMLLMGSVATLSAAESISISCYIGNRYIGSIVVFDVRTSADACNSVYYDCKGECSGCFQDFDYVTDVCINTNGVTYLRY